MGEMAWKVRSEAGQGPSSDECCRQEEVVGVDEGALGSEAKGEGIGQSLTND
jgi:hypothetical protein